MAAERLASVSVDLDTLVHYARIHGLAAEPDGAASRGPIYATALPRLMELFAATGFAPTLFVIGEDLEDEVAAQAIRTAHGAGAEIGNHSHRHRYDLSRASPLEIHREVTEAEAEITRVTGERPVGFRAPGYALTGDLYGVLARLDYQYDSSVFPAAPYYLAKAAVMAGMGLIGRRSRAILDHPGVLLAPRRPYRPEPRRPYERGPGVVRELPIAVAPYSRVPFFGTGITAWPAPLNRSLYRSLRHEPFLNLELHAIDVLDPSDGLPPELVRRQAGASVPAKEKLARLEETLRSMAGDFRPIRLREAASRVVA